VNSAVSSQPTIQPVVESQRVDSVDILRGVALLGILVINIDFFALPGTIFFDPASAGGFEGLDLLTWKFGSLLFLQKMMAIFSMLFGAGVILMHQRAEEAGRRGFGGVWYRRTLWLLLLGMIHAYFMWYGDILVTYALCAFLIYLFRRRSPRTLIILGVLVIGFGMLIHLGSGFALGTLRDVAVAAEESIANGESVTREEEQLLEAWRETVAEMSADPEAQQAEIDAYRGGYLDNLAQRVPESMMMQTQALLFFMLWRALGLMLIGMAMMKAGVFSAARSRGFYVGMLVLGYGIGLPLQLYGSEQLIAHDFEVVYLLSEGVHYGSVGSILIALGHVALVMLICKAGLLRWLTDRLAAVGRMAFTNYFTQTILCTTLFYGFGFGLFGSVNRFGLIWIVFAIWVLQLLYSPWWLKRFRFGPMEWLWRSLTYWKRQPMRVGRGAPE